MSILSEKITANQSVFFIWSSQVPPGPNVTYINLCLQCTPTSMKYIRFGWR